MRSETRRRRDVETAPVAQDDALALAIEAKDWERAALLVALGMHMAARLMPPATIDDVLSLLAEEAGHDGT